MLYSPGAAGQGGKSKKLYQAKLWFGLAVATIVVSVICLWLSQFALGSPKAGFAAATFLWAILTGWFFTFIAPAKVVSTLFGALVGTGGHQLATGTGLVTGMERLASEATNALAAFLPALVTLDRDFIGAMVWLHLGIIFVLCMPALFRD